MKVAVSVSMCLMALIIVSTSFESFSEGDPVYVVEVTALDQNSLQILLEMPLIITNRRGLTVTVYCPTSTIHYLQKLGYTIQIVEVQLPSTGEEKITGYPTYAEVGATLAGYAQNYPHLCHIRSLGQSVQGREIWAIQITENPLVPSDKPTVKYISTIHGDEPVGTYLLMRFVEELITAYATTPYIEDLLERTVFWIVPIMNPDGYVQSRRTNANSWDLNRSFPVYPTQYVGTWYDTGVLGDIGRQPEVAHIMQFHAQVHGALAANFHCGELVANYPYDNEPGIPSGSEAPSPDDDVFRYISLEYSRNNVPMYTNPWFPQGITNGSAWYSITGGMMDWNYRFMGCPEVTMEISRIKKPAVSQLPQLWLDNRNSLYAYAECAHLGIRGVVFDRTTGEPIWAKIMTAGRNQPVFTNPEVGNYHRLLLPGNYDLSFHAVGYIDYFVDDIEVLSGSTSRVDVPLSDGDLDGNEQVNDGDIRLVIDAVLGRNVPINADVDGRGLSATDIQSVINKSMNKQL